MNEKVLTLTVSKQWFDMIVAGEKKEEYRTIKGYRKDSPRIEKEIVRVSPSGSLKKVYVPTSGLIQSFLSLNLSSV